MNTPNSKENHVKARHVQAALVTRPGTRRSRTAASAFACVCALLLFAGIGASSASAAQIHPFSQSFGSLGHIGGPGALAIDPESQEVYATGFNTETEQTDLFKFDPGSGELDASFGESGTLNGSTVPGGPFACLSAVATDPSNGDVYVADNCLGAVYKLTKTGALITSFGDHEEGGSPEPNGSLRGLKTPAESFGPNGLAVDPNTHDLYVADINNAVLDVFDEEGAYLSQFSVSEVCCPNGVAVDSESHVYVSGYAGTAERYSSTGSAEKAIFDPFFSTNGVAVDPSNDQLYVSAGSRVFQYSSATEGNEEIGSSGSGKLQGGTNAIALDTAGDLFAGDQAVSPDPLFEFGPAITVQPPTVTIEAPSLINAGAEKFYFAGHINPGGSQSPSETTWRFECVGEHSCPGNLSGEPLAPAESPQLVSAETEGLEANTVYTVVLHAENQAGEATSEEKTFKTPQIAPGVATGTNTPEGDSSVLLRDYINRRNTEVTDCHIEYGPTTSYGQSAPCGGIDEQQKVTVAAASGSFKLTFGGKTTPDLPYNASSAEVREALEALSSIGAGNVRVVGGPGDAKGSRPYKVTFVGSLAETDVEEIAVEAGATPLGGQATVTTVTDGSVSPALNEQQKISIVASGGQFRLSFGGQTTGDLAYNVPASGGVGPTASVRNALGGLSSIGGTANVSVSGGGGSYTVTFTGGPVAAKNVEQIAVTNGTIPLQGHASVSTAVNGATALATLNAGPGNQPQELDTTLKGLAPGATYHYRLLATSAAGASQSADASFETFSPYEPPASCPNEARRAEQHSTYLPECRAYEQVSPPNKAGGDVMANSQRTQIASDGSAASFASLVASGDVVGTSVASEYESVRGAGGWSTHAITPPQLPPSTKQLLLALQPGYAGAFSSDLFSGVFLANSPLTDDPSVAAVPNIYVRDDLRSAGPGSYQLASACPLCEEPGGEPLPPLHEPITGVVKPYFAGASADFGHVLFESQRLLTAEAAEVGENCSSFQEVSECHTKLYESDHGTVRLVGLVPPPGQVECGPSGPSCEPSLEGSVAGQGAGASQEAKELTPNVISADGSRAFFIVPKSFCGGAGTPPFGCGALYLRQDHESTVRIDVSERNGEVGVPASQPSTYWGASADGSRVFFISNQALTNDAQSAGDRNLYMYDASKPTSDPHNLTLLSADHQPADGAGVQTVLGMSSDGSYVYFAAAGQLVAGQPILGSGRDIYVWHDGTVRAIANMSDFPDSDEDSNTANWELLRPTARVTPDGLHLLFSSTISTGPTGYDQGACGALGAGCRELYLYSYPTQRLSCASCNPSGAPATASAFTALRLHGGGAQTNSAQDHPLSDDGRHLFFSTKEALVPSDTNGAEDVYSYDAESGTFHLISSGTEEADSYFMGSSADGSGAFFLTRQRLTGTDTDGAYDLYDANAGGGFAEPPPAPAPCASGETCHGAPPSPPTGAGNGSSTFSGPPNPPVKRPHRHKRHHRRHHHKRAANRHGRTSK